MFTPTSVSPAYSPAKGLRISRNSTIETAAESPYHARAKSIGKRLNNLTVETRTSSATKVHHQAQADQLENRIREVDHRITENHTYTEERLNKFTDDVNRVDETLAAEILARELLGERVVKEMTLVESNLALELRQEREQNKETERRTLSKVEGRILAVRAGFQQECDRMDEYREEQTQLITEQFNELHQGLKEEQNNREHIQDTIIKTISTRINKVQETLEAERKMRKQTDAFLLKKFEEITSSLDGQVQAENEKRQRAESQMLRLLEEACDKFEHRINNNRLR